MIQRPHSTEYAHFYGTYIRTVPEDIDIVALMDASMKELVAFFKTVEKSKANYRYAPEKWTVKEVLIHLIDTERIMAYRALRIARGDKSPIEGFEQDDYVRNGPFGHCRLSDLVEEFMHVRRATVALFRNLDEPAITRKGIANKQEITARALAYIIAGHELHHRRIVEEKYFATTHRP